MTLLVTAVALGASAGVKDVASAAVSEAYTGLKRLLGARFGSVDVVGVEAKPDSEARQAVLCEDLREVGAGEDPELRAAARRVVEAVESAAPEAAATVGVDLARVRAAFLDLERIDAEGTGVRVVDGEFTGGVTVRDVRAGRPGDAGPSPR